MVPVFLREKMSHNRFRDIMKKLRFNRKSVRTQHLEMMFVLFSDIWNIFIENCVISYKPVENTSYWMSNYFHPKSNTSLCIICKINWINSVKFWIHFMYMLEVYV